MNASKHKKVTFLKKSQQGKVLRTKLMPFMLFEFLEQIIIGAFFDNMNPT